MQILRPESPKSPARSGECVRPSAYSLFGKAAGKPAGEYLCLDSGDRAIAFPSGDRKPFLREAGVFPCILPGSAAGGAFPPAD